MFEMDLHECVKAAKLIDSKYMEPICKRVQKTETGKEMWHLRWMVTQMSEEMDEGKAMRWLGYIQGIMVGVYDLPLTEMIELNRKMINGRD